MKTQREQAATLLRELLAHPEGMARPDLVAIAEARGVSVATLTRVAREMGVEQLRNGRKPSVWRLRS